tara:strand:+ start:426 stop:596 length:171 start_codon:yes stop_codon:yes gene_type:complete
MKYIDQTTTYKKKGKKIYEVIEKEIDISSLDNDIIRIERKRDSEYQKLLELRKIRA